MVNSDCAHLVAPNPLSDRPATSAGFEKADFYRIYSECSIPHNHSPYLTLSLIDKPFHFASQP